MENTWHLSIDQVQHKRKYISREWGGVSWRKKNFDSMIEICIWDTKKEIWANSERSCLTDPSIAGIGGNILVGPGLQSKLINAIPDQKVKKKHLQSKTDQMQLLSSGPFHWGYINCIHRERWWWQKRWRRFSYSTSKSTSIMMAKRAINVVPPETMDNG